MGIDNSGINKTIDNKLLKQLKKIRKSNMLTKLLKDFIKEQKLEKLK